MLVSSLGHSDSLYLSIYCCFILRPSLCAHISSQTARRREGAGVASETVRGAARLPRRSAFPARRCAGCPGRCQRPLQCIRWPSHAVAATHTFHPLIPHGHAPLPRPDLPLYPSISRRTGTPQPLSFLGTESRSPSLSLPCHTIALPITSSRPHSYHPRPPHRATPSPVHISSTVRASKYGTRFPASKTYTTSPLSMSTNGSSPPGNYSEL